MKKEPDKPKFNLEPSNVTFNVREFRAGGFTQIIESGKKNKKPLMFPKQEFRIVQALATEPDTINVMAGALGKSPQTVKNQITSIYHRLTSAGFSVRNNEKLIATLISRGTISYEPSSPPNQKFLPKKK